MIASDGDIEEGITHEASSLAGHQQLGSLIVFYDSNQISIEDDTNVALSEDVAARYEAYGWHVQTVDWKKTGEYVEDVRELHAAIEAAQGVSDKPSLIILKTIIGWPSPTKQNTGKIHGSALGADELAAVKKVLGFDPEETFVVADDVLARTRTAIDRGKEAHADWQKGFDAWAAANADRKKELDRILSGALPDGVEAALPVFEAGKDALDPCRERQGAQRARPRDPRALGRFGRPRRVEQHDDRGRQVLHPDGALHARVVGRALRPHAALRHPRARDGRDPVTASCCTATPVRTAAPS